MGTVHDLLEAHGKQGALQAGLDRNVVEAAALYMGDEDGALNFVYSGWAQCALPHRRLPDDKPWEIAVERIRLVVEPGRRPKDGHGLLESVGVRFGSHARLILLYLQTEALRHFISARPRCVCHAEQLRNRATRRRTVAFHANSAAYRCDDGGVGRRAVHDIVVRTVRRCVITARWKR
jgi:hypothetical protein